MARTSSTGTAAESPVQTHPLYALWRPVWAKLLDVYEGGGGFLSEDKPYLLAHPREWLDHSLKSEETGARTVNPNPQLASPKLKTRRRMARYENVAATVLDAYRGALFREDAQRAFGQEGKKGRKIEAFWADADGRGHSLTDVMRSAWTPAGVFGASVLVMDRAASQPQQPGVTPSLADAAMPILRIYSPLDLVDWILDDQGELSAVKLLEPEPRTSLEQKTESLQYRIRIITRETWTLTRSNGEVISTGKHGFGRLPVVLLYGRRRALIPVIGQSVLHDPQLYIDLYNLISECRELLRNQTFGVLNVPLGPDGDIEKAQSMMGDSGTQNVLFSHSAAGYLSPDADNVRVYHEEMDRLLRTIYRLTAIPWEGDSRAAESAESRSLKRADLHQVLSGFARELESADEMLTELFYRGVFADSWEKELAKDEPYTAYPTEFDVSSIEEIVGACDATLRLELGETAVKASKKRTARRLVPGLSPAQQVASDKEIDDQAVETTEERHQRQLQVATARFVKPGAEPNTEQVPDPAKEAA